MSREEFMDWTLGLWEFRGQDPRQHGHPAPFPEELPYRLIKLFSFTDDTILDPFVGSGTTTWVAKRLHRKSIGVESTRATARSLPTAAVNYRCLTLPLWTRSYHARR